MVRPSNETGGRFVDRDGLFHAMIDAIELITENNVGKIKCAFSILAGTDLNQVGKTCNEKFPFEGDGAFLFWNLAEAARLLTHSEREQYRQAGVAPDIDETLLKGRQVGVQITMERARAKNPTTGKWEVDPADTREFARIGKNAFDLYDNKMNGVQLDPQMASLWPKRPGQNPPAPSTPPAADGAVPMTW